MRKVETGGNARKQQAVVSLFFL